MNLAGNLCHLGRFEQAALLLPQVEALAGKLGNQLDLLRVAWQRGKIAAGQGRAEDAISILERLRSDFAELGNVYDAALVTLEVAAIHASLGHTERHGDVPLPHRQRLRAGPAAFRSCVTLRAALALRAASRAWRRLTRSRVLPADRAAVATASLGGRSAPAYACARSRMRPAGCSTIGARPGEPSPVPVSCSSAMSDLRTAPVPYPGFALEDLRLSPLSCTIQGTFRQPRLAKIRERKEGPTGFRLSPLECRSAHAQVKWSRAPAGKAARRPPRSAWPCAP
jgi:hypothetical protein